MAQRTNGLSSRVNDSNVKWYTLIAACFALFMAILDNLVVNIAMPTIARDLDASTTELQWIVSAYTLIFASLQITAGGLGDRLGRKRWFLFGLALFTVTSALAALSQNIEMLIIMRALQGLGAAFIMPLSLSLISAAFPPEERGKAVGIWSAISVSGLALGPVVGGLLVEYLSWEWVFLVNIPIGIIAFFVTSSVVRESKDETGQTATDIPGTVLITAGIAALTYGLIEAGERGWGDPLIIACLIGAVIFAAAFIAVEARVEKPMVPLRFFKSRNFTGANIDSFMISFLVAGIAFFMTLYQQNVRGYTAVRAGLAMVPMVAVMMVASPLSAPVVKRFGTKLVLSAGMIVTAIGQLLMLRAAVDASYWDILPGFLVMGFGMSFLWAPMTTAMLNSVDSSRSGIASAINGSLREIGTAFGIALLGTLGNQAYRRRVEESNQLDTLRADTGNPAYGAIQGALEFISEGPATAGYVLSSVGELADPLRAAGVLDTIRLATSDAFVYGMERSFIISSIALVGASLISYALIDNEQASGVQQTEVKDEVTDELAAGVVATGD